MVQRIYYSLLLAIFSIGFANAQTYEEASLRQELNSIFCGLNKNRVPTGLLLDYAIECNYEMVLLNTNYELIQEAPFAVLCKPEFPEPLTPPIQLNPIVD